MSHVGTCAEVHHLTCFSLHHAALQNYDAKTEKNSNSGIVIPLLPFGMRKYDEGERFDLRSPYSDDGWVSAWTLGLRNCSSTVYLCAVS